MESIHNGQCLCIGNYSVTTAQEKRINSKECSGMLTIIFFGFIMLSNISTVYSFNIHISENDPGGTVIFQGGQGEDWRHSLDYSHTNKQSNSLIQLDYSTGIVYLKQQIKCSLLQKNIIEFRMKSWRRISNYLSNYTLTPVTVLLNGQRCAFYNSWKSQRLKNDDIHYIVIHSNLSDCIAAGQNIISLLEYIPITYQQCSAIVDIPQTLDYVVDFKTLHIKTLVTRCFNYQYSFAFNVLFSCPKHSTFFVPYRVIIHPKDNNLHSELLKSRRRKRAAVNHAPVFDESSYLRHVKEEQEPGLIVETIAAHDADQGEEGIMTYTMIPERDEKSGSMFAINPRTGTINTTKKLDREGIEIHYFQIIATDNGRQAMKGYTSLKIIVDDINDHAPQFEKKINNRNIVENQDVDTNILTVKAIDVDIQENADIRYSFLNPSKNFMIDPLRGIITNLVQLDRERQTSYRLVVQAIDQGEISMRKSTTATVNINILDLNDNKPQFSQSSYIISIKENIDVSKQPVILHISATDLDEGSNKEIRFSLTGNVMQTFNIDSLTGELHVIKALDFEHFTEYRLNVRAEDSGNPSQKNSTTILVQVLDVNDNAPQFHGDLYRESVDENAPAKTPIIQLVAFDLDSGPNKEITYSIVSKPISIPLEINPKTGWIFTTGKLDREISSKFGFKVQARDNGVRSLSATTSVVIIIRDINDNSPIFKPRFYETTLSEDSRIGTRVITVTAVDIDDGDNGHVMYGISAGNTGGTFQISTSNGLGVITLQKALDARVQNRYAMSVTAQDPDGNLDTTEVFINISDTNRYRPEFQGVPYQFNVDENVKIGTSVYKVFALDKDRGENARIVYSFDGHVSDFSIDQNTGEMKTIQSLDRESGPAYTLTIVARDNGKPSQSDITDIDIIVNDINDNKPEFSEIVYKGVVKEDILVSRRVIQITATDRDKSENGQIYYTFKGGNNGNGDFNIDRSLGTIRVASPLDRERVASYELVAFAVDEGEPALSTSVTIKLKVEDINDNRPKFESEIIEVGVPENSPIGTTLTKISAEDADEGVNALVEYSFVGGTDADLFSLVGRRGEPAIIITKVDLDYESDKKQYEIVIRAASDTQFSTATVLVKVQDVNDNPPILKDFTIIFNNYVDHFPSIGRIPAFDPDEIDRDHLEYRFISGNGANLLHLNTSSGTGEITLDPRLNSDVPRNGTFVVSVSDRKNTVKATCHLYVRLITENMLLNSVTIRLNKMTQTAFLSPLFKFFVDALATILHTDENNIFVINVQDDTDVDAQILNVTVSVRKTVQMFQGSSVDVFYPSAYLQELIYLQRVLLANLSTLQVLPFDDNLCMREPCTDFEDCKSTLVFGSAPPFIMSDTMLFRPIHPENGYRCECPKGFTGMSKMIFCDMEVDLCYSMPCKNGGSCFQKENGYTCLCPDKFEGHNCEVNITAKFDAISCPKDMCRTPSYCVPLIQGGFRCDGCPDDENYDKFCRLRTRSFSSGSSLTFPSLRRRHRFQIELRFATQERNGLLFYNGRFNEQHDFISLEVVDGQIIFSFSLGASITSVHPYIKGGVSNGEWWKVKVEYLNRQATVTVGENCDTEISVRFGNQPVLGNYSCAARALHLLPEKCNNPSVSCHRLLDLTGPLQIGGLPGLPTAFQVQNRNFVGCIRDFHIDMVLLDLNTSVANLGTEKGCSLKRVQCRNSPCKFGGKCKEGWNTFFCDCPEKTGGKDCSQVIESSRQLSGNGYLSFSDLTFSKINFPWYNGLAFKTRNPNVTLMQIVLSEGNVRILLLDGYIIYLYNGKVVVFDGTRVNDGNWHYFESRWYLGQLQMFLDYGQRKRVVEMPSSVLEKTIKIVYVGGYHSGKGSITNYFNGCVKDIRVGNVDDSLLKNPRETNTRLGCTSTDVCTDSKCGSGNCIDTWENYSCICPPGTVGPQCTEVCTTIDPCQNYAECKLPQANQQTYTCECGKRQKGRYCEIMSPKTCPVSWWGDPVCGPCNCPTHLGFNSSCDKTNGTCLCKENHYRRPGEDKCSACDCYKRGSESMSCDTLTGQCKCVVGVIGRRCDQCSSRFAEVQETGCVIQYNVCPRSRAGEVWWDRTAFGVTAVQDCPHDADGDAKRECFECEEGSTCLYKQEGWQEADLFNCTNKNFTRLSSLFKSHISNTYTAKNGIDRLVEATNTTTPIFGGDIIMSYNVIREILIYECRLQGLNLTSEQHSTFIQRMLIAMSNISKLEYEELWERSNMMTGGAGELVNKFETYVETLAKSMAPAQSTPFDAISDNMVLAIDWINKGNTSSNYIPKYDHIAKKGMFDNDTRVKIPPTLLYHTLGSAVINDKIYTGFVMYKTIGNLMAKNFSHDVRTSRPIRINSPVVTVVIVDAGRVISGRLVEPIEITFRQLDSSNRSSPQCVYWKTDNNGQSLWSKEGCEVKDRYSKGQSHFIVCSCSHLSTFAVLMDVADREYLDTRVVTVEILTYIVVVISLMFLFMAFIIFMLFKRLQCNWNSIHINFIVVVFIAELAFIIGINKTKPELFCRLIAITLQYFYMAAFSWLFVEILHIYRMLTEIRTVNYGSMKFYYLIGYAIPGIIVGLAVGLYTDGYGNGQFCWLYTTNGIIWSFAGPIAVCTVISVFTFILAIRASLKEKIHIKDIQTVRMGLMSSIILLAILCVTWVIGLISVNYGVKVLHYVFACLMLSIGVFIFVTQVLLNRKVRLQIKKASYRIRGKKLELDENLAGTRSTVVSRSALAYRHESSSDGGLHRINIGISTTSTTSQSTSKSSGVRKDDYLRSTSSSTSGHVPSGPIYPPNTGIPPYGYDPSLFHDKDINGKVPPKAGHDSDSDSDGSAGNNSLDLASSHSSDDEDADEGSRWDHQVSSSKIVENAKEQLEKHRKEKEKEKQIKNNNSTTLESPLWPGDRDYLGSDAEGRLSSKRPDILTTAERPGRHRRRPVKPPPRTDSLVNNYNSSSATLTDKTMPNQMKVQVLTHNGHLSSDSESGNETSV